MAQKKIKQAPQEVQNPGTAFRCMAFIWENYEKEQERRQQGISRTKGLRYPPILSVAYYEGTEKWTAPTSLQERIFLSDIPGGYMPDYHCLMVQLSEYINNKLIEKEDELKLNAPEDEAGRFADQVKKRKAGELFANFKCCGVKETKRIAKDEGRKEGLEALVYSLKPLLSDFEAVYAAIVKNRNYAGYTGEEVMKILLMPAIRVRHTGLKAKV